MTDDLERRLRAADPTASPGYQPPSDSWISDLVEATMNDTASPQPTRRWVLPAAAAAVLVLGSGGYVVARHNDGSPTATHAVDRVKPMHLVAAKAGTSGPGPAMCVQTTVGTLTSKPVAFSGTVVALSKTNAVLTVDHWYRGGDNDKVVVALPKANVILPEGAVHWTLKTRYLVTATDGIVDGCGFSMPWTAHLAALYTKAFA